MVLLPCLFCSPWRVDDFYLGGGEAEFGAQSLLLGDADADGHPGLNDKISYSHQPFDAFVKCLDHQTCGIHGIPYF